VCMNNLHAADSSEENIGIPVAYYSEVWALNVKITLIILHLHSPVQGIMSTCICDRVQFHKD
jgi:hypothetical protein